MNLRKLLESVPRPTRLWAVRLLVIVVLLAIFTSVVASYVTYEEVSHKRGTITSTAEDSTVISVQGFHFQGEGSEKKPSGLVSVDERAQTEWTLNGSAVDWPAGGGKQAWWSYDVDPLPNGNLLVVTTFPNETLVYELDPDTQERVWEKRFVGMVDTHDVSSLNEHEIAIAHMRNYDEETERSDDRIIVYNRTTDEITWEWLFRDHYPAGIDGGHSDDWTHVNAVKPVDEHRLLLSPRNFDQVVVVNRTTDEIEMQLGADDEHQVLHEQHNPDYLESEDGRPTILVADSENDRIVEYALSEECERPEGVEKAGNRIDCGWELVWELGGEGQFNWPRDADRLPNGNTLVTDSLNHRVVEVTPTGEIVWEYYVGWGPYDAERLGPAAGSRGPTMQDLNVSGSYDVTGSAGLEPGTGGSTSLGTWLSSLAAGTPVEDRVQSFAQRWNHVTPWIYPAWMTDWDFAYTLLGLLVGITWSGYEVFRKRRAIGSRLRSLGDRSAP